MTLTPDQQKRFDDFAQVNELYNRGAPVCKLRAFLESELQLERERFLTALRESEDIFPGARSQAV